MVNPKCDWGNKIRCVSTAECVCSSVHYCLFVCEWQSEVTCVCYTVANKASLALIDSLCDYRSAQ